MNFADLLPLIDERSAAFRAAVAAAPDLDAKVPTCPEWTLADLRHHLVEGRHKWAAIVAAGPADAPPPKSEWETQSTDLARTTGELLDALRAAGPDRGCWGWWGDSQSPLTTGAAARHQLQEIAVHTYDAQLTIGAPQPLPTPVALDGVEEFLETCCATTAAWPHTPAVLDHHTTEGPSWRLWLSADGARVAPHPNDGTPADASLTGTASDVVLLFYGRADLNDFAITGDKNIYLQLIDWDPTA